MYIFSFIHLEKPFNDTEVCFLLVYKEGGGKIKF